MKSHIKRAINRRRMALSGGKIVSVYGPQVPDPWAKKKIPEFGESIFTLSELMEIAAETSRISMKNPNAPEHFGGLKPEAPKRRWTAGGLGDLNAGNAPPEWRANRMMAYFDAINGDA